MPQVRRSGSAAHTHALRIQAAYFNIAIGHIDTPAPGRDFAGTLTSDRQGGLARNQFDTRQVASHLKRDTGSCIERRSEEHTSELQSLMRISYAVFCLKK